MAFFSVSYGLSSGIWSSKSTTSAATSVGSFSTTYAYFEVCNVIFLALKSAFSCENHTGRLVGLKLGMLADIAAVVGFNVAVFHLYAL